MTVLEKTQSNNRKEKDGFMFAAACIPILCADYIEFRLIYGLEPLTLGFPALYKSIEIIEKSLKVLISTHKENAKTLSWLKEDFGHNIEKLRKEAATINPIFNDSDIKKYTHPLTEKTGHLYQKIRYGSHDSVEGMKANLNNILPIVDKVFFNSLLLLPDKYRKTLNFCSPIKNLLTNPYFDQTKNPKLVLELLRKENKFIGDYEKYCITIDEEQQKLREDLSNKNKIDRDSHSSVTIQEKS